MPPNGGLVQVGNWAAPPWQTWAFSARTYIARSCWSDIAEEQNALHLPERKKRHAIRGVLASISNSQLANWNLEPPLLAFLLAPTGGGAREGGGGGGGGGKGRAVPQVGSSSRILRF
ncbi:uncharacterized protein RSE6_16033 [Rhynchosporium secalis]|uniref:Uncharacterized protein n=1 Tax=Rhynchosporium secalis TaxID=38038 RepID=A0A1E1M1S4_RHYSE|nr:uncharacterized protein RSE6_16033 [Rhynchosporium secalis]